jgi:hypothetical protein
MNKVRVLKICGSIINLTKWLSILLILFEFYSYMDRSKEMTLDTLYTLLYLVIFFILSILSANFVKISKKYFYNFEYFHIDKKINAKHNITNEYSFPIEEYEDIPEPSKFYLPGLACIILGICLLFCTAILLPSLSSMGNSESSFFIVLFIMLMSLLLVSISHIIFFFFMTTQHKYYKMYYNILILGSSLIDELIEKNKN